MSNDAPGERTCRRKAIRAEDRFLESVVNYPMTPYVLGIIFWMLAWWIQMGPLRPIFNFAPGVELPFFPAGIRTLAVFVFGFPGAIAIFIGSLATYSLYFPEMISAAPTDKIGCAAASAFSSYLAIKFVCNHCRISHSLAGLNLQNIAWIVVSQSLISATLFQCIYHDSFIATGEINVNFSATLVNWSAMATGDALGSMAVLFAVLIAYQLYSRNR